MKNGGLFVSQWPLAGQSDCLVGWGPQVWVLLLNLSDRHWDARQSMLSTQDEHYLSMLKGQSGLKHGNRSKRQALKSASTDLGMTDVGE